MCVIVRAVGCVCVCVCVCDKSKGNHGCVTIFFCCRFVGRLPNLSILCSPANVWLTNARQHIYCMFDIFSVWFRVVFAFASVSFHKIPVSHATFIDIFKGFTDFNRWLFCINSGDEDEFRSFLGLSSHQLISETEMVSSPWLDLTFDLIVLNFFFSFWVFWNESELTWLDFDKKKWIRLKS